MRRAVIVAATLLVATGRLLAQGQPPSREVVQKALGTVAFVRVDRMFRGSPVPTSGTAFFIDGKGTLLTNWHVIAPQVEVEVYDKVRELGTKVGDIKVVIRSGMSGELVLSAKVLASDRKRDLAAIAVAYKPDAWIEMADNPVAIADQVCAIGYPFGDMLARNSRNPEVTATFGHVTSVRHDASGAEEALQVDAAVNPGNSGGPMLDAAGRLVGVINAGIVGANATSFAIPMATVRAFLDQSRVRVTVDPDAVFTLDTPLAIHVVPLLLALDGYACTFSLTGDGVPQAAGPLQWKWGEFQGSVKVPLTAKGTSAASYTLTIALADGHGTPVLSRRVTVPVRGIGAPIQLGEDPGSRLEDRKVVANEAIGGILPIGTGEKLAAQMPGRAALSDLAKDVKIKKSADGSTRITNDLMDDCFRSLKPESYAGLDDENLRTQAQSWDEATCNFQAALSAFTRLYGRLVHSENELQKFNSRIDDSVVRLRTLYPALRSMNKAIQTRGLCRCESGVWAVQGTKTPCNPCETPEVPPLA
jgi:hypothetical protein